MLEKAVGIVYTNHKGVRGFRWVIPLSWRFGTNQWYPEKQWLMNAYDLEKRAEREFACDHIHTWER